MDIFNDLSIVEHRLLGKYDFLAQGQLDVEFDLEMENPQIQDFRSLLNSAAEFLKGFTESKFIQLKSDICKQLTDAAYAESAAVCMQDEVQSLERQLTIYTICFFMEDVISLIFKAEQDYPDLHIYCQINAQFEIEDLMLAEPQ